MLSCFIVFFFFLCSFLARVSLDANDIKQTHTIRTETQADAVESFSSSQRRRVKEKHTGGVKANLAEKNVAFYFASILITI